MVRGNKNDVSVYALSDMHSGSPASPVKYDKKSVQSKSQPVATPSQATCDLYQLWGGYLPLDQDFAKKLSVRRYSEH